MSQASQGAIAIIDVACQWLMDQEKALEIEEIERLQCELQAQEDPATLGREMLHHVGWS